MAIDAIIIKETDSVATAVRELKAGQSAVVRMKQGLQSIKINEDIPFGHKFAVRNILCGENIIKYGEVIGRATSDIGIGCHAHVQNIESMRGRGDLIKGA